MSLALDATIIIATLNRSSEKTHTWVLIEDKILDSTSSNRESKEPYRFIQRQLQGKKINIFPCLGKGNLMAVFNRRAELGNLHVIFFRDKDFYVHQPIPSEYNTIMFTRGYSIENDVYAHTTIEQDILTEFEQANFNIAKQNFIRWYASKVHLCLTGTDTNYDINPHSVLGNDYQIVPEFAVTAAEIKNSLNLYQDIINEYPIKLRGHSLFALLLIFIHAPNRTPKINYQALMKYCVDNLNPPLLMQIINEIEIRHENRN